MMECLSLSVLLLEDNSFFYEMQGGLQLHGILSSSPLYFEFKLMGASRPQTPRCFLVLDYLFSSTRKLQFYVELAISYENDAVAFSYSAKDKECKFEWRNDRKWNYQRVKIAYIPAERNIVLVARSIKIKR